MIQGTLRVPKDILAIDRRKKREYKEDSKEGEIYDVIEEKKEEVSDVQNQRIILCDQYAKYSIDRTITTYAAEYNLSMNDFGKTWPSIKSQADELMNRLDAAARSRAVQTTLTDKAGDYKFQPVPKGRYYVYSAISHAEVAVFWIRGPIDVTRKEIFTLHLESANVRAVLWSKQGTARSTTSPGIQLSPSTGLVPPPPP